MWLSLSQLLCALPEVGARYGTAATVNNNSTSDGTSDSTSINVFKTAPQDVAGDFPTQVSFGLAISHNLVAKISAVVLQRY